MSGNTTAAMLLAKATRSEVDCDRSRAVDLAQPEPEVKQIGKLTDQEQSGGKEPQVPREAYVYRVKTDLLNPSVRLEGSWDDFESHCRR